MYDTTRGRTPRTGHGYVAKSTLILGKYLGGNETGGDCEPSMAGQRGERSSCRGAGFDLRGLASRELAVDDGEQKAWNDEHGAGKGRHGTRHGTL